MAISQSSPLTDSQKTLLGILAGLKKTDIVEKGFFYSGFVPFGSKQLEIPLGDIPEKQRPSLDEVKHFLSQKLGMNVTREDPDSEYTKDGLSYPTGKSTYHVLMNGDEADVFISDKSQFAKSVVTPAISHKDNMLRIFGSPDALNALLTKAKDSVVRGARTA